MQRNEPTSRPLLKGVLLHCHCHTWRVEHHVSISVVCQGCTAHFIYPHTFPPMYAEQEGAITMTSYIYIYTYMAALKGERDLGLVPSLPTLSRRGVPYLQHNVFIFDNRQRDNPVRNRRRLCLVGAPNSNSNSNSCCCRSPPKCGRGFC